MVPNTTIKKFSLLQSQATENTKEYKNIIPLINRRKKDLIKQYSHHSSRKGNSLKEYFNGLQNSLFFEK